jgi:GNAT superfamily N-acetyltransferase
MLAALFLFYFSIFNLQISIFHVYMIFTYSQDSYLVSTDPELLDLSMIHAWLSQESYWASGIPFGVVEQAIRHSLNFGLYHEGRQIGFARAITDQATFAYLADVFVLEAYRGRGLSKWLMSCIMDCPALQGLRRFMLMTRDAHSLYTRFGFGPIKDATKAMEITRPGLYQGPAADRPDAL